MYLSNENTLPERYKNALPQFVDTQVEQGQWERTDGKFLHYRYVLNPEAKAWIVIMQGRAESAAKYTELMEELYQNAYSVFTFDHIGQGQSSRLTENPQHGYINDFDDYVLDANDLVTKVIQALRMQHKQANTPQYLLAHSMGGAIATMFLHRYPNVFDKAVLCSPMYKIQSPIPEAAARHLVSAGAQMQQILGIQSGYFLGQDDFETVDFSDNKLTSCQVRYEWFRGYYHDNIEQRLGGVTFQWLAAALSAMEYIEQNAKEIVTPILGFRAMADEIVDNPEIEKIFTDFSHAHLVDIEGAKHEILFEKDKLRHEALKQILAFFV